MNIKKTMYIILPIIIIVAVGIFVTASDRNTQKANTENQQTTTTADHLTDHSDPLAGTSIDYYPEKDDVTGYISLPDDARADNPVPAVILIHEMWGLDDHIKHFADEFANQGYVALAVDLYGEPATASHSAAKMRSSELIRENMSKAMANIKAAKAHLQERDGVDGKRLALVGWQIGGDIVYRAAKEDMGLAGVVTYYGEFLAVDDFSEFKTSILGHYGEDYGSDVSWIRKFKTNLESADKGSKVYIYPNANTYFATYRGGNSYDFDRQKAEKAWNRTLDFLEEQFDAQTQSSASSSAETATDSTRSPAGSASSTVFLRYSVTKGQDDYTDGDRTGRDLSVMFSGEFNLYTRTYRETDERQYVVKSLVKSGSISQSRLNDLQSSLEDSGFYNYPKQVPQFEGRPRIEGPADTVSISARPDTHADLKKVNHKEGARGGAYPDGFENVEEALQKLMQRVVAKN